MPLRCNVTLPLMTEAESIELRRQVRQLHPEIEFTFSADLDASRCTVTMHPPEDQPEAEIDRVALLFQGRQIEKELTERIRAQRNRPAAGSS
jgi:hypothetical protein